jgi:hypothetical protein
VNLSRARIVLRPRSRLECLDLAFRYVSDARGVFGRIFAALLIPAFAATAAARGVFGRPWWEVWLIAVCLGSLLGGAFTVASGKLLFEDAPAAAPLLSTFARRFRSYFGAWLLSRLLIGLGSLVVIAGPSAWVRWAFVAEAALLEDASGTGALRRSARISSAGIGRVLGMLVTTVVISFAIVFFTDQIGFSILEDVLSIPVNTDHLMNDGGSYLAIAGYFISVPWAAAGRFLVYVDDRTRQDGWDVQVRLMALGEGAPA